jgi:AhpD family alkylhydroperoxidase
LANKAQAFFESFPETQAAMRERGGEIGKAFMPMHHAMMKASTLSVRDKELISLGIAVAVRCESCIYLHTQKCLQEGATPEQIMEAAGVAVMMGGGPAFMYAPLVAQAIDYLKSKTP